MLIAVAPFLLMIIVGMMLWAIMKLLNTTETELSLFPALLIMMPNQNSSLTEGASIQTLDVRLFLSSLYVEIGLATDVVRGSCTETENIE